MSRAIADLGPDILLLTDLDWDAGQLALAALSRRIEADGHVMPHLHAPSTNAGLATGKDLDGDGRRGTPRDAQGYGRFHGDGGMAILSRFPVDPGPSRDFGALIWADLPWSELPQIDGGPFPSAEAATVQRLSSVAHWDVAITTPDGPLHILASNPTPPVFDGPEDRNGLRNADEIRFWARYLDGALDTPAPTDPVVLMGNLNLDPLDGDGRHDALQAVLAHPRLQDPRPSAPEGRARALAQGGANAGHGGDPSLDTADWADLNGPGNLRVSYILPDSRLTVRDAGLYWTPAGAEGARRHALAWVDIDLPAAHAADARANPPGN